MKDFDLNIENVLENWTISNAIREIIANALDEQTLTQSKEIEIFFDSSKLLHIRDYGRGLEHIHFTQNENIEKLSHPNLIGRFGVGLKDALATFNRNNNEVRIISKHNYITIGKSRKHGFFDIFTLHAHMSRSRDTHFVGTEFIISNCNELDVSEAKSMFLKFSNVEILEETSYGSVIKTQPNESSIIYINGVKVAQEDRFLFSYNITSLNASIKKALNRERTNVGREAYSERVKSILLHSNSEAVIDKLVSNLNDFSAGTQADELRWTDIALYAVKRMNSRENVVFTTPKDYENTSADCADIIKNSGRNIVFIPETVKNKLSGAVDDVGDEVATFKTIVEKYSDSFVYKFVEFEELTPVEKDIFGIAKYVTEFYNAESFLDRIYISETIRPVNYFSNSVGVWDEALNKIIIKRCQLQTVFAFAGTLLHELIHAKKGLSDVDRDFEIELTNIIGILLSAVYSKNLQLENNRIELV